MVNFHSYAYIVMLVCHRVNQLNLDVSWKFGVLNHAFFRPFEIKTIWNLWFGIRFWKPSENILWNVMNIGTILDLSVMVLTYNDVIWYCYHDNYGEYIIMIGMSYTRTSMVDILSWYCYDCFCFWNVMKLEIHMILYADCKYHIYLITLFPILT